MKTAKAVILGLLLGAALIALASLTSCNVGMGPDGKPVVGIDPVALASAINAFQKEHGSKDATVVVIEPPVAPQTVPIIKPVTPETKYSQ